MSLPLVAPPRPCLTVTELTRRVRNLLEDALSDVWVVGEISNLRVPSSGHWYFCLKDRRSQVAAVMFRSAAQVLPFRPEDGMEVIARGRVSVYEVRGDLQFYVDTLEPRGAGSQQVALEQLKRRLAAEGLFAEERKRPLPRYPRVVGVVTALTGAAVHDILTVLRARWPTARVIVSPVRVQGKGAGLDIVAALAALNRVSAVEVIIVGRGGGSIEDLWAFNEERVARAIAASRVPVVSAVGHEIDVTVADLVADRRAPTPTAAAQLVVPEREALRDGLGGLATALERGMARRLRQERERAAGLGARLRDPRRVLQMQRQRIDELGERAAAATAQRVRWAAQRLQATGARLHALSPLAVLDRGYSIVAKGDGTIVRAASAVDPGESLAVRLAAGRLQVRVEDRRE